MYRPGGSIYLIGCRALAVLLLLCVAPLARADGTAILPSTWAFDHYGNDASWFQQNVPAFDCSDAELVAVYAYRWQLYKSHFRDLGDRDAIVTEFLNDVGWAIRPTQSLNDATAFHIEEGRWLRDRRPVTAYVDYMYAGGGNDRHFSEAIAAAVYDKYLVDGDRKAALRNLDSMRRVFNQWNDHYDPGKHLYYIEPLLDATEYSIASIEASGGRDGFRGGNAFRPTINSFMYANAMAISHLADLAGDLSAAGEFSATARRIKATVQQTLWNDQLVHFVDRYQANNQFVHYWDFVPGRELEGYVPWSFELPDDNAKFAAGWSHLLSPDSFASPFGLRTVEPSYQYYMRQYRYEGSNPECQWNGPSWPFDSTLVLTAMAKLLNDYKQQTTIHPADYLRLLRQYAHQHYLDGTLDLQEDYNPDTGRVIVGLPRSHHYNHSEFNNLIITGLVGLRPRGDNTLEINPLIDPAAENPITWFCLENASYHGHLLTIVYDSDGKHYDKGAGLSIYVDGRKVASESKLGKKLIPAAAPVVALQLVRINRAVNIAGTGYPKPSASINNLPQATLPAVDGRILYWPNMPNYWTTAGSTAEQDWYAVDFGKPVTIDEAKLFFYSDGKQFQAPSGVTLRCWSGNAWKDIARCECMPAKPIANGENAVHFAPVQTSRLQAVFDHAKDSAVALVEIQAFSK